MIVILPAVPGTEVMLGAVRTGPVGSHDSPGGLVDCGPVIYLTDLLAGCRVRGADHPSTDDRHVDAASVLLEADLTARV